MGLLFQPKTTSPLQWQLDQVYAKPTPRSFVKCLRGGSGGQISAPFNPNRANPWVGDTCLYVLLLGLVVACVYILIRSGKDMAIK